ncbi:hypothetical protein [Streptosporangium sp. NPDC051022]|uniref:hypothetical protein n=1 Tax=Streptosporangium sp. NPDC051022 TaxID=3155752 RepID=UPI00342CC43F
MTIWQALFGVLFFLAACAALAGCVGLYNLMLSDKGTRWWAHAAVWLASVVSLALLVAIAVNSGWMTGRRYSREISISVQQPQPVPTSTVKLDLPGTPTAEQCRRAVNEGQAKGSVPSGVTIVAECY